MRLNAYNILGIPVQNLTLTSASEEILNLIYNYETNDLPKYISTINPHIIAGIHGWDVVEPHNPELLQVIRESSVTTADGFPVVLLSHILGSPLTGRVTSPDLIPELLDLLSLKGRSIYILCNDEDATKEAVKKIRSQFKGLKIVGIANHNIFVEGQHLMESPERDAIITEQINAAKPDVLLICLGMPVQEIWFKRVKKNLRVPVAIGVGRTLNYISGKILRAPPQVQSIGLEWLWRLVQEPRRLFFRFIGDFFKLIWLSVPLIIYHLLNAALTYFFRKENQNNEYALLFISARHSICAIRCPTTINSDTLVEFDQDITNAYTHDAIVLNMRHTLHLDLKGIAYLIKLWSQAKEDNKKIFITGLHRNVKWLLIFHKAWDILRYDVYASPGKIVAQFDQDHVFQAIYQYNDSVRLAFFGHLDQRINFEHYLHKLTPILQQKNCVLDFTFCSSVDNTALGFLLKIRQLIKGQHKKISLKGLNKTVKNEFKSAKIYHLFK